MDHAKSSNESWLHFDELGSEQELLLLADQSFEDTLGFHIIRSLGQRNPGYHYGERDLNTKVSCTFCKQSTPMFGLPVLSCRAFTFRESIIIINTCFEKIRKYRQKRTKSEAPETSESDLIAERPLFSASAIGIPVTEGITRH